MPQSYTPEFKKKIVRLHEEELCYRENVFRISLRALLIQKGLKRCSCCRFGRVSLRALLIQKGLI